MVKSDLTAPLGMNKRRGIGRLPFGLIGVAIMTVLLTTGLIWIGIVDDPNGGEPMATIELSSALDGVSPGDIEIVSLPDGRQLDQPDAESDLGSNGNFLLSDPKSSASAGQSSGPTSLSDLARRVDYEGMDAGFSGEALSTEPIKQLLEPHKFGSLPKISAEGIRPLDVYARRPSPTTLTQARIAILVNGIGLNSDMTLKAIEDLPADISLGLSPYGDDIDSWMQSARLSGHEVLLQAPMEPFDYPDNDAGPQSLLTNLDKAQNEERLSWVLGQTSNYVGLVNFMGDRFTSNEMRMNELLSKVRDHGLMYVDDGTSPRSKASEVAGTQKVPFVQADLVLDQNLNQEAIGTQLLELEVIARQRGIAVATATAFPVTLAALEAWSQRLEERGLSLVPISSAINSTR
ncbi:Divergent polysaccharide deacetylase [Pseudovibrio axinellae]|uniref:Divergent polysaccharide deacetylase n=1 Tax=Pseudovibrio axinellae TaxID=989403 RepID=A0A165YYR2_9HYPH|nr:divergent polysaccharide deacetylase family protein [Pseudovibrio axinellae]KZL19355.1 Divergent polysaccharide deacetylase [Pseudovibrio axinellae]SEQ39971.1 hypothetical protein SAMN05421798_102600 [Pseudovibrio axinellae]